MRLALISDIHEDLSSFNRTLDALRSQDINQVICLGDIIGSKLPRSEKYFDTRDAQQCVLLAQQNCHINLLGNHDLFGIKKTPSHTTPVDLPEDYFQLNAENQNTISKETLWTYEDEDTHNLSSQSIQWLKSLPESAVISDGTHNITLSHYFFTDLTGLTKKAYKNHELVPVHMEMAQLGDSNISFIGHEHPNGADVFQLDRKSKLNYGHQTQLNPNDSTLVICPAIANMKENQPGYLIFDTARFVLEAYEL